MPTILKIGYESFLMRSPAAAAAAVKCLSEAVKLDEKWSGSANVYFPNPHHYGRMLGIEHISDAQLLRAPPQEDDGAVDLDSRSASAHGDAPARRRVLDKSAVAQLLLSAGNMGR